MYVNTLHRISDANADAKYNTILHLGAVVQMRRHDPIQ